MNKPKVTIAGEGVNNFETAKKISGTRQKFASTASCRRFKRQPAIIPAGARWGVRQRQVEAEQPFDRDDLNIRHFRLSVLAPFWRGFLRAAASCSLSRTRKLRPSIMATSV